MSFEVVRQSLHGRRRLAQLSIVWFASSPIPFWAAMNSLCTRGRGVKCRQGLARVVEGLRQLVARRLNRASSRAIRARRSLPAAFKLRTAFLISGSDTMASIASGGLDPMFTQPRRVEPLQLLVRGSSAWRSDSATARQNPPAFRSERISVKLA